MCTGLYFHPIEPVVRGDDRLATIMHKKDQEIHQIRQLSNLNKIVQENTSAAIVQEEHEECHADPIILEDNIDQGAVMQGGSAGGSQSAIGKKIQNRIGRFFSSLENGHVSYIGSKKIIQEESRPMQCPTKG